MDYQAAWKELKNDLKEGMKAAKLSPEDYHEGVYAGFKMTLYDMNQAEKKSATQVLKKLKTYKTN